MDEYIEREAVLMYAKMFIHIAYNRSNPLRDEEIEKAVNEIPAADVAPVRHGRLLNPNPYGACSLCGCLIDIRDSHNYCPDCGAKMDGEA